MPHAVPSRKRSSVRPARIVVALGILLFALMAGAVFVVLGTEPSVELPGDGGPDEVAGTDVETSTDTAPGGTGRRAVRTSGGAAADVAAALRGRLRAYRTREPVSGMTITMTIPAEKEGAEPLVLESQSDSTGTFRFTDLPPRAGCSIAGTREPFAPVAVSGIDLAPLETHDVGTIWLDVPVDLPVDVMELDGTPIASADVAVFATAGGAAETGEEDDDAGVSGVAATPAPTATATTDASGAAVVQGLLPGSYHVRASADGHGVAFADQLVAPDAPRTRVRILLARAHSLTGVVLDADGAPVAAAQLIAAPQQSRNKAMDKRECTTNADGSYELTGLAPGVHTLYLARPEKPLVLAGTARIPEMTRYDVRLRPTSTLVGVVTDTDGAPFADAQVQYQPQGGVEMLASTGEDGAYRLEDVPSGASQYFRVRKDGYIPFPDPTAPQQGTGEALREGAEVRRDVVLERGVAVAITVVAKDGGAPIEAARIELRMAQMWGGAGKPWTTTTGEDGTGTLPGIVPGTYLVLIKAPGWVQPGMPPNPFALLQTPQAMPAAWRIDVAAETTVRFELERGGTVSGVVEDADGAPFAGALVTVTGAQSQAPVFSAADGTFTVDAVPALRRTTATATAPGAVRSTSEPFKIDPGEAVQDVEIRLQRGARLTGRVRSSEGRPLEGAYVRYVRGQLNDRNPWGFQQFDDAERFPVSADGTFEIPGVEDGPVTVRADADGHLPGWDNGVKVAEGRDAGGIDLILEPATQIEGRVETQAGEPVVGATVTANYTGTEQQRQWGFVSALPGNPEAQTDGEGRFVLRGLKPGSYRIWANAPGHAGAQSPDAATGAGEIVIRLGKAERIAGIVKGPDGKGLGGVPVRAQSADQNRGREVNRGWWGGGNQVFTAPDGTFEMLDLSEGIYDLTVSANWIWGRDVNVKDTTKQGVRTGTTDVEILVEAGTTIEGRVLDGDDKPISAGWVSAVNETGNGGGNRWGGNQRWARVGPDGSFRISGLEPGAHTLQAYGAFQSDPMRGVSTGTNDVELRVRAGFTIQGQLLDGKGLSVATGFNVQIRKAGTDQWAWTQTHQPGDGVFILTGLEDSAYDVKVQASPFAPVEIPKVVVGTDDLQILLALGQEIEGTVVGADGNPVAAWVSATQTDVTPGSTPTNASARAQADGVFKLVGLVDAEYRLYVRAGNHAPAVVERVRGGSTGVRVALEIGTTITGTVKYEDGAAVPNARLQLQAEGGVTLAWTNSGQDGTFTFNNVPSTGSFELSGNVWGGGQNVQIKHEGKIEPGATDVAVVVR